MQFDDRLATVLRAGARTQAAARTQYRQLLDLLGSMPDEAASELAEAAYRRLEELAGDLPPTVQSQILRSPDLRLRNSALLAHLAQGEPQAAAAAMATARLSESDWLFLIPRLPMTARGFLRHRRNLPASARQVLERLGVRDLVLPEPAGYLPTEPPAEAPPVASPDMPLPLDGGIADLVRRIEAFQEARRQDEAARRRAPEDGRAARPAAGFDFATGTDDRIAWADPAMAALAVGMTLGPERPEAVAALGAAGARALARRLPLRAARAELAGPAAIAGTWLVDAAPAFDRAGGGFTGYRGRMRRPAGAGAGPPAIRRNPAAERMRQVLHELRTPVGAIQGFAELIQQQLFGPAPNTYRALAAAVAVDAARLLAGFEEIDRLARLESGADALETGTSDFREVLERLLRRLEGALRPRRAAIEFAATGGPFGVGLAEGDALELAWRLLATLAGALAPGEAIDVTLAGDAGAVTLRAELPAALLGDDDLFSAADPARPGALSAGMFGHGFTLRLARAEAAAVGGSLERHDDLLILSLPALTAAEADHSVAERA
ncbi:MAG: hypothetical protein B7Z08_06930 [Sphingomonadales bacterium 32-68-7]|nr:MAG: hypothetical protein B7Z33_03865 [Sphingomonadales bacterium 12-68-11]OYX08979.1 MAG: hypothetical protein B7Z08_06930 [Sphingomonadales bacterium 32-68-7]